MITNPFTYGNPISDPTRFFGRRLEVNQIFSRLRNVEFESSSLVGERRIGKTSLLKYLMDPEVRRFQGLDPDKYIFVYIDLEMLDTVTTPTRLWKQLLRQMARLCDDAEVKRILEEIRQADTIDNFLLADLFDSLDDKDLYVVFLLDEFENVTENQNFDPAFFYGLRSLAIHHHLSLITSSRRELIELCHSEAIRSSPFFNIFANINVRLFTENEVKHLISELLAGTDIIFTMSEKDFIFQIAGYHPYFLQSACSFLFEAYSIHSNPEERIKFLIKKYREEATPHFDDYWRTSYEQEKIVLTALALLKRQRKIGGRTFSMGQLQELYERSDQTLGHLEKRGLVIAKADTYSLFNVSFGEWICGEITDTMHDQQSYEDWLKSNKSVMERLSHMAKNDLGEILPEISSKYRELIITWASDPRNLIMVAGLLKAALGFG
jgi:AAA+ ATPase superfamily predicted ATPase